MSRRRDVLDLLRRANPVPPSARPQLAGHLQGLRASGRID